jgi:hypothetical protein
VVIDHIERIVLPESEEAQHFEARMALARLGEGLSWLYRTVGQLERQAQTAAALEDVQIAIAGGLLDHQPLGFLSCAFQWYAVSACNYAQLVGWLSSGKPEVAKQYMNRVLPRLSQYRNKVAAHMALTDPRRDNEADLAASVMTQVMYAHGRLCAAALFPVVKDGDREIQASRDFSWSLTLAHERLIPRWWPDGPPKAFQSMRVPPGTTTFSVSWSDLVGDGT